MSGDSAKKNFVMCTMLPLCRATAAATAAAAVVVWAVVCKRSPHARRGPFSVVVFIECTPRPRRGRFRWQEGVRAVFSCQQLRFVSRVHSGALADRVRRRARGLRVLYCARRSIWQGINLLFPSIVFASVMWSCGHGNLYHAGLFYIRCAVAQRQFMGAGVEVENFSPAHRFSGFR